MRRIIAFLVIATAIIAFAWWLAALPGTFNIQIGDVTLATSTPVALLGLLALFFLIYLILRLIAGILRLPTRSRRMHLARQRKRGDEAVTRTLLALAGGDAEKAQHEAKRSRALLGDTPQTLLLAAYAGRQGGDQAEADEAFNLLAARKDAAFLGLRGLYQGAVARGDWPTANQLAQRAEEVYPGAAWLRTERARLATREGSWREVLELSGPEAPIAALATAASLAATDPSESRRLARRAWQADPAFAPGAIAYARRLREAGREKKAQTVLKTSWGLAPHPAIAALSLAGDSAKMSREARADWLAAAAPEHPESLFMQAQTALDVGLLKAARSHVDAAVAAGLNQQRVWLLVAAIAEQEGNPDAARDALRRLAHAEPDPHWRCEACGHVHADWHPACSNCSTVGRITWGTTASLNTVPPRLLAMGDAILP